MAIDGAIGMLYEATYGRKFRVRHNDSDRDRVWEEFRALRPVTGLSWNQFYRATMCYPVHRGRLQAAVNRVRTLSRRESRKKLDLLRKKWAKEIDAAVESNDPCATLNVLGKVLRDFSWKAKQFAMPIQIQLRNEESGEVAAAINIGADGSAVQKLD